MYTVRPDNSPRLCNLTFVSAAAVTLKSMARILPLRNRRADYETLNFHERPPIQKKYLQEAGIQVSALALMRGLNVPSLLRTLGLKLGRLRARFCKGLPAAIL